MENILKVEGLTKWFGKTQAINDLSFRIERGQVVGILGPNGSGKTTTLSIILGLKYPSSGTYRWFNDSSTKKINKRIGSLIEVPFFYPYLTLTQNLEIVTKARGSGFNQISAALDTVGLLSREKSKFYTLSLGMKQRLAIASALLGNTEVLVLDEPTNGLDPEGIADVRNIIKMQSQLGKTIILASHILDEVEKVCTHTVILKNGNIISKGNVAQLLSKKQMISISASNMNGLLELLQNFVGVEILEKSEESVTVSIKEDISSATLNEELVKQGVVPSSITLHKASLETEFLELIKHNQPKNH
ncbi:MAG: ABC transporter ATP-binding protein [Tenuifilaceae bacterium]|nr:ABC transporter ATP-binding protein [Tenuifilaceae bacterium]